MGFPKINLHIHSNYSDGKQNIKQIVERALKLELNYIAITDHFTNSWKSWVSKLNNYDTIIEYLEEISNYQIYLKDNAKNLMLYKGLEVDLSSSEYFIKKYIQPDKYELILFEYLQSPESIAFIKNIIHRWKKVIKDSNELPILGLAHFDPSYFIHEHIDVLIPFLKEYNIYFEFNPTYATFYSRQNELFFEKLRENLIPVAIGCDSHRLSTLDNIEEPIEMIEYYNLGKNFQNLIETLRNKNLVSWKK
ncbi:hypothetical protein LCGC14_1044400 [marine sediment metagenome]|uniref:Polymerase/histidinol phosphatase N-terminal domain-containing protein n=1 Tax=marine sediment metagenome TaxID=412755 RepID=A0A0F9MV61_9ZZZZ